MPGTPTAHVDGLLAYLRRPDERANEDLALAYFRAVFGGEFTRQSDAARADGYVPGRFVLELKSGPSGWLAGLIQALAYGKADLAFRQVVVAAREFLAVWQVDDLPADLRDDVARAAGPPNRIGRELARRYAGRRRELLALAGWDGTPLFSPLFASDARLVAEKIGSFEAVLKSGRAIRQRITTRNFTSTLKEMVPYFDQAQPLKAVRAFYSMLYGWGEGSVLSFSQRAPTQAALGGEVIGSLIPSAREAFKDFVERRFVHLGPDEHFDDFFARYDEALDAVDPEFRRRHGIYFTDLYLSKFVMWAAKRHVPDLGQNYLVLDPACGSGNLVTNWRSPLDLRHKVVSEIEPELLFAVEQRMKGDAWHNSRFTVVPKVTDNRGLNFLDRSAETYLAELQAALAEKGHSPDKPLAILCNPPYRSDEEQSAGGAGYEIDPSILALTGADAANERYCCFLAQMKRLCETAASTGLPGRSLLLLFTKAAWLTDRSAFRQIRSQMAGAFRDVAGLLLDGSEFFAVKGAWPVAFTIWEYRGEGAGLDSNRPIHLTDLTWLKRKDLARIAWGDAAVADDECRRLLADSRTTSVALGMTRPSIREWAALPMLDFKRDRRKRETDQSSVGGLPAGDRRRSGKKTYGESDGANVGFMDDLTPCRVRRSTAGRPWFRLNAQFMDVRKNRCLSGPPTNRGYCAGDLESAERLFLWYAIARTLLQHGYPMWADADDLWEPVVPERLRAPVLASAFAIAYAENECVEAWFPANNPVAGVPEAYVVNPLTPLVDGSFWNEVMRPVAACGASPAVAALVRDTDAVFQAWRGLLGRRSEVPAPAGRAWLIDERPLTRGAGLIQIRDYAVARQAGPLLACLERMNASLKAAKAEFHALLTRPDGIDYFHRDGGAGRLQMPEATPFEQALARRLAVAGVLVQDLHDDPNFGRTKLAKLFYLADARTRLQLRTRYAREAAGPLDARALYNKEMGIEALAEANHLFRPGRHGRMIRYEPLAALRALEPFAARHLAGDEAEIRRIASICRELDTEQSEIVATLYACWNDLLAAGRPAGDPEIIEEFRERWHEEKKRFARDRLARALAWMREKDLVPSGQAAPTRRKG